MKLTRFLFLAVLMCSQITLAYSKAGVIVGSFITAAGVITMVASGIVRGVASDEEYCEPSGQTPQSGVIGTHDCSYQVCAVAVYNNQNYVCNTYYTGNGYAGVSSCQYISTGYSTCLVWQTVQRTCNDYGCVNPNDSNKTAPYLHRKNEPTYSHSLYAVYAGAGVFVAGLATLLPSIFCCSGQSRGMYNPNGD